MVKKQRGVRYAGLALTLLGMFFLSVSVMASGGEKAGHPDMSEQEMLVACSDCHRDATPEIEKEWYNSVHGIGMVKCYQCHGTFETFVVTPTEQNCAICHTNMAEQKHTEGKVCWECHVPHSFKEKK